MDRYRQELESMGIDCCTAYFILKVNQFIYFNSGVMTINIVSWQADNK